MITALCLQTISGGHDSTNRSRLSGTLLNIANFHDYCPLGRDAAAAKSGRQLQTFRSNMLSPSGHTNRPSMKMLALICDHSPRRVRLNSL
jgi:hypothetical protein